MTANNSRISLMNVIFNRIYQEPRIQIGLTLFLISLYTVLFGRFFQESIGLYTTVLASVIFDGLILRFQKKRWVFPYSAIVTGFLIGLILNPDFAAWQFVFVAFLAISSKYLILPLQKHIFNPAALGLVVASIFFNGAITWWGVSWVTNLWVFLFIVAGLVLWRLHRIWLPIGFLLIYWAYFAVQGSLSLTLISDPTITLFALIMLPEPQTSSIVGHFRYSYGAFVAVLVILISVLFSTVKTDPLLVSLLLANIVSLMLRKAKFV